MKTYKVLTLVIVSLTIISGCASIVSKSQYPITITSEPNQANIEIIDDSGRTMYNGKTPTTVTLEAKAGFFRGKNYKVKFSKEGYSEHTAEIKRSVDGWYILGNLVFGGLIGWLIVDPATGAMWTLQQDVFAALSPQAAYAPTDNNVQIVLLDDVPESRRSKMVQIR